MALHRLPQPTIAKVSGVAVGAGCNLALGCDLIVASDDARFSEIFAKRGLTLDAGGSWLLPRLIGLHRAKEMALFAEILSAKEAEALGLVNRVVPAAQLDAFVDEWAHSPHRGSARRAGPDQAPPEQRLPGHPGAGAGRRGGRPDRELLHQGHARSDRRLRREAHALLQGSLSPLRVAALRFAAAAAIAVLAWRRRQRPRSSRRPRRRHHGGSHHDHRARRLQRVDALSAEFVGKVVAGDARVARFQVLEVRQGTLPGSVVDVDYGDNDDRRFVEQGKTYLVAVAVDPGVDAPRVEGAHSARRSQGVRALRPDLHEQRRRQPHRLVRARRACKGKWGDMAMAFLIPTAPCSPSCWAW